MLSFSSTGWIDWVVAIILFMSIIFNGMLHYKYKELEMDRIMMAIEKISVANNDVRASSWWDNKWIFNNKMQLKLIFDRKNLKINLKTYKLNQ